MRSGVRAAPGIISTWWAHIGRHVWVIGAVLALLTLVGTGLALWNLHRRAINEASDNAGNLGVVLAENASRHVQVIDLLLQEVQSRVRDKGISTPQSFRDFDDEPTHQFLIDRMKNLTQAHGLALFDADGDLLNTSYDNPPARFNIVDREYFQYLRGNTDDQLYVSAPAKRHTTGTMSIFLGRRISGPDGSFLGVAMASIDVDYLLGFYKAISRDGRFAVTLVRRDGLVLARYPATTMIGERMPASAPWYARVTQGGGTYRSPGYLTGIKAIVSVTPVRAYPLVVDVSTSEANELAAWWQQVWQMTGGAIALACTLVALLWGISRQIRRQEEHNAAMSRATEALRASESRLRDFAELASDWFWEQDADLRLSWVALASPVLAPHNPSDTGKLRWDINDVGQDPERWEAHQREILARRPFRDYRYDAVDEDGHTHHVSITGKPLLDESGVFAGYRGIGQDITAQIEAEREVRQSKERAERAENLLQDAVDSIAEGFVIYDADGRLVTCNDSYRRLYPADAEYLVAGTSFEEILRHGLANGGYPDAIGREDEWIETWLNRHREAAGATEQPLTDGRWVLVTKRRMRGGGVAGLRINITALKQTQAALRDSEAHLERAQEIAAIGSWELDLATDEYIWSRQLYRIRGQPPEYRPTPQSLADSNHADDLPAALTWLTDLRAGSTRDPIELRVTRPDGETRVLRVEGRPVVDPDGVTRRLAGTMQDVTERRMIERQLAQSQKLEALGTLTGGMAHDFNNGLGIIMGNLDLLRMRVATDATGAELCADALDGAQRCAELIRRLLAFARRQPLRPEKTDVNVLVGNIVRLLGRTLGESVALKLTLGAACWPVNADPAQLEAALVNLATNARDAMTKGGNLDIRTKNVVLDETYAALEPEVSPGEFVLIEVTDSGTGIPPEVIGHIFEPFFTTKAPGSGTGLGLAMAFGFVKQSGGHLTVYSELGRGSTFRLYLPRGDAGQASTTASPKAHATIGGDETVLMVEDNSHLREVTRKQLSELGYQVHEAEHAEAALAILASGERVDLLFSDVVMPGAMDGVDLAFAAIGRRPDLKVLLTSGFPGTRGDSQRLAGCPFALLNKPYRRDELARTMRVVLDSGGEAVDRDTGSRMSETEPTSRN
jgi:PAS domain S-box-containing protein